MSGWPRSSAATIRTTSSASTRTSRRGHKRACVGGAVAAARLALPGTSVPRLTLGDREIDRDFALALLVGIVSGTYSSIFNASCLLVVWEHGGNWRLWRRQTDGRMATSAAVPAQ